MKKIKEVYESLDSFTKKLGDEDFTVSIAVCEGKYYISVSCHSSKKYKFDHGGLQRTAEIKGELLDRNINKVLGDLVNKYRECLIPREPKESIEDAIERNKEVSEKTSR